MAEVPFNPGDAFQHGQYAIDFKSQTVKKPDGEVVPLTKSELRLFSILNESYQSTNDIRKTFSARQLVNAQSPRFDELVAQGEPLPVVTTKDALGMLVMSLRKKLGPGVIESFQGFGYRIAPPKKDK